MRGALPSVSPDLDRSAGRALCAGRENDRVPRILARQHAADLEPVRQDRRHVLAAVDGEVDLAGEQRVFDFLHEQPLAADLRERRLGQPVAGRLDDDDLALRCRRVSRSSAATALA